MFGALTRSVRDAGADARRPRRRRAGLRAGRPDPARAPADRRRAATSRPGRAAVSATTCAPRSMTTAALLRSLGHTVVEGKVDLRARDVPVIVGLILRGVRDLVAPAERPQRLERRTRAFARPGALLSERTTERLLNAERAIAARLTAAFDDHDLLLTPVMSAPAVPAGIMEGRGATVTYFWETRLGPVHDPLEHHRPARRLGPGRILRRGAAARGADRGPARETSERCSPWPRSSRRSAHGPTAGLPSPELSPAAPHWAPQLRLSITFPAAAARRTARGRPRNGDHSGRVWVRLARVGYPLRPGRSNGRRRELDRARDEDGRGRTAPGGSAGWLPGDDVHVLAVRSFRCSRITIVAPWPPASASAGARRRRSRRTPRSRPRRASRRRRTPTRRSSRRAPGPPRSRPRSP